MGTNGALWQFTEQCSERSRAVPEILVWLLHDEPSVITFTELIGTQICSYSIFWLLTQSFAADIAFKRKAVFMVGSLHRSALAEFLTSFAPRNSCLALPAKFLLA